MLPKLRRPTPPADILANRRRFLRTSALLAAAGLLTGPLPGPLNAAAPDLPRFGKPQGFSKERLLDFAAELARSDYDEETMDLPSDLQELSYDQYRDIRYRPEAALWSGDGLGFRAEFFHPGFYFQTPVRIMEVSSGMESQILYSPDLYDWGPLVTRPEDQPELHFSGFRLRNLINDPAVWDEFCVFQGATYFRAVAQEQLYGLSARGLAIGTGSPEGEEFPLFSHFWLERPDPGAESLVVHALLDSQSCSGVYSFVIRPGEETVMDVELHLFARREIENYGIGALTSMFLLDEGRPNRIEDFRPSVHDSEGLLIRSGKGEQIWRSLRNPERLEVSSFADKTPRGFGLIQRDRSFERFEDLEARYELRPSAWIEPMGDWGAGAVQLVEIPTEREVNDNIVAFWRPDRPLEPGVPFEASYRLRWCNEAPKEKPLAEVTAARSGPNFHHDAEQFVIDFAPIDIGGTEPEVRFSASNGELRHIGGQVNPYTGGYRVRAEWRAGSQASVELRAELLQKGERVSEVWLYRWSAE